MAGFLDGYETVNRNEAFTSEARINAIVGSMYKA
jgi:hypothetical protein